MIITARGTSLKSALIPERWSRALLSSNLMAVRLGERLHPELLLVFLQSASGRQAIERVSEYAGGRKEAVDVTGPFSIRIHGRDTAEEALVLGDEILIGQTVLETLDLHVDAANRRLVPNPAHPDQTLVKVK